MHFNEYLTKTNTKNIAVANAINVSDGYISKLRKKEIMPSLMTAIIISQYCNGKVSIIDLIPQGLFDNQMKKRGFESFDLKSFPIIKKHKVRKR